MLNKSIPRHQFSIGDLCVVLILKVAGIGALEICGIKYNQSKKSNYYTYDLKIRDEYNTLIYDIPEELLFKYNHIKKAIEYMRDTKVSNSDQIEKLLLEQQEKGLIIAQKGSKVNKFYK